MPMKTILVTTVISLGGPPGSCPSGTCQDESSNVRGLGAARQALPCCGFGTGPFPACQALPAFPVVRFCPGSGVSPGERQWLCEGALEASGRTTAPAL